MFPLPTVSPGRARFPADRSAPPRPSRLRCPAVPPRADRRSRHQAFDPARRLVMLGLRNPARKVIWQCSRPAHDDGRATSVIALESLQLEASRRDDRMWGSDAYSRIRRGPAGGQPPYRDARGSAGIGAGVDAGIEAEPTACGEPDHRHEKAPYHTSMVRAGDGDARVCAVPSRDLHRCRDRSPPTRSRLRPGIAPPSEARLHCPPVDEPIAES